MVLATTAVGTHGGEYCSSGINEKMFGFRLRFGQKLDCILPDTIFEHRYHSPSGRSERANTRVASA